MEGAHGVLLSIAGGSDLGLFEINEAASLVQESAHEDANIIFGTVIDDSLGDEVRVTVIAAGFDGVAPARKSMDPAAVGARSVASGQGGEVGQSQGLPPTRPSAFDGGRHDQSQAGAVGAAGQGAVQNGPGGLPPRAGQRPGGFGAGRTVPVEDEGDDEVDVPPFMRR